MHKVNLFFLIFFLAGINLSSTDFQILQEADAPTHNVITISNISSYTFDVIISHLEMVENYIVGKGTNSYLINSGVARDIRFDIGRKCKIAIYLNFENKRLLVRDEILSNNIITFTNFTVSRALKKWDDDSEPKIGQQHVQFLFDY